jgi:hypothetical protein
MLGERELASLRARDEKFEWSAIPISDLEQCSSSLSFFDSEGMRFHIPAFLLAELERGTADIVFILCNMQFRFDLLTPDQREAVRVYLRIRLSEPGWGYYHPMIESALREYWSPAR